MSSNKPCPKCREIGRDKTGDHLFLMEDGVTWCCNKPYHNLLLLRDGDDTEEGEVRKVDDVAEECKRIKKLPFAGNEDRMITPEVHEYFKVRTEFSVDTGLPEVIYYPETSGLKFIGFKKRKLPKGFSSVSKVKGTVPDFFGQYGCPRTGKRLLITGGEEDAMAAYSMLKERYPELEPCVVSVPRGEASSMATFTENLEFLKGFEEIILGMDMDEAGRKAVSMYAPLLGDRARILVLSEKDASDMRVKGKHKEFINAYFNAQEYRPVNILSVADILDKAITPRKWGLTYPFPRLTMKTYGMKEEGEIISIGAGPGKQNCPFVW